MHSPCCLHTFLSSHCPLSCSPLYYPDAVLGVGTTHQDFLLFSSSLWSYILNLWLSPGTKNYITSQQKITTISWYPWHQAIVWRLIISFYVSWSERIFLLLLSQITIPPHDKYLESWSNPLISCFYLVKTLIFGAGEMSHLLFQRTWVRIPDSTLQFTTVCNPNPKRIQHFLLASVGPQALGTHIYIQAKHSYM